MPDFERWQRCGLISYTGGKSSICQSALFASSASEAMGSGSGEAQSDGSNINSRRSHAEPSHGTHLGRLVGKPAQRKVGRRPPEKRVIMLYNQSHFFGSHFWVTTRVISFIVVSVPSLYKRQPADRILQRNIVIIKTFSRSSVGEMPNAGAPQPTRNSRALIKIHVTELTTVLQPSPHPAAQPVTFCALSFKQRVNHHHRRVLRRSLPISSNSPVMVAFTFTRKSPRQTIFTSVRRKQLFAVFSSESIANRTNVLKPAVGITKAGLFHRT